MAKKRKKEVLPMLVHYARASSVIHYRKKPKPMDQEDVLVLVTGTDDPDIYGLKKRGFKEVRRYHLAPLGESKHIEASGTLVPTRLPQTGAYETAHRIYVKVEVHDAQGTDDA